MQVGILGPLVVRGPDGPREIAGTRLRRLLVRLAVDAGRVVSVVELVDAVWASDAPADPTNALQTLVSRLRRALGDGDLVQQVHSGYRLVVSPDDVDAVAFSRAARRGRDQLAAASSADATVSDPGAAARVLRAALELWRGPALEDAGDAEYAGPVAARLDEERLETLAARVEADLGSAERGDARGLVELVAELEDLTRAYPLREGFTAQLMRALASSGRPAEALTAYQRLRETLADTLGTDPSAPLRELHTALLRDEHAPGPDARNRGSVLHVGLNSFLGREDDQARLLALLAYSRLSTVVGPGGSGKTRLATEVARQWQLQGRGPVWMVELAPVTDAVNVLPAFLESLHLREARMLDRVREIARAPDDLSLLAAALDESSTLLVVDNCEHLLDPTAQLVEALLLVCPRLRVLATSREPLALDGEALCPLPPLELPPWDVSLQQAPTYAAVALFVERAAAARPELRLDSTNLEPVVEIVRRLDGLPLAIELAAARVRTLPVAEVASRLSDRFRLLTGGRRTALPRHQTLRAVVQWSWDLLGDGERLLAERLSVFPAGATPQSASAVCCGEGLPAADIPTLLGVLVDKSLLAVSDSAGLRYRMLETIREFGVERLAERAEVDAARQRHAEWFAEHVHRVAGELFAPGQVAAAAILEAERDNILAALRFLGETEQAAAAVRLALELSWYWAMLDNESDALRWLTFALQVPGEVDPLDRALATATALLSGVMTEPADSAGTRDLDVRLAEAAEDLEALAAVRQLPPQAVVVRCWIASFVWDEPARVERILESGLRDENAWVRAAVRMFSANHAENAGDVERMREDAGAALREFARLGDRWGEASALSAWAQVQVLDGDLDGAIASLERAGELMSHLKARGDEARTTMRIASLFLRQGDLEKARRSIEASSMADQPGFASILFDLVHAGLALAEGDPVATRACIGRLSAVTDGDGDGAARGLLHTHLSAVILAVRSLLQLAVGDLPDALRSLTTAYPSALATRDMPIIATYGVAFARAVLELGRATDSATLLGAAARVRGAEDPTDPVVAGLRADLVGRLGPAGFDTAYARGWELTKPTAIARLDPALVGEVQPQG